LLPTQTNTLHAFQVVVALWRCVGDRTNEDGRIIYDRHGENPDPMVRLREEIIRCFITESPDQRRKPLTYQHQMNASGEPLIIIIWTHQEMMAWMSRKSIGILDVLMGRDGSNC
jgi:hypothetical protein